MSLMCIVYFSASREDEFRRETLRLDLFAKGTYIRTDIYMGSPRGCILFYVCMDEKVAVCEPRSKSG